MRAEREQNAKVKGWAMYDAWAATIDRQRDPLVLGLCPHSRRCAPMQRVSTPWLTRPESGRERGTRSKSSQRAGETASRLSVLLEDAQGAATAQSSWRPTSRHASFRVLATRQPAQRAPEDLCCRVRARPPASTLRPNRRFARSSSRRDGRACDAPESPVSNARRSRRATSSTAGRTSRTRACSSPTS